MECVSKNMFLKWQCKLLSKTMQNEVTLFSRLTFYSASDEDTQHTLHIDIHYLDNPHKINSPKSQKLYCYKLHLFSAHYTKTKLYTKHNFHVFSIWQ